MTRNSMTDSVRGRLDTRSPFLSQCIVHDLLSHFFDSVDREHQHQNQKAA